MNLKLFALLSFVLFSVLAGSSIYAAAQMACPLHCVTTCGGTQTGPLPEKGKIEGCSGDSTPTCDPSQPPPPVCIHEPGSKTTCENSFVLPQCSGGGIGWRTTYSCPPCDPGRPDAKK
jgi:hypothetical protein